MSCYVIWKFAENIDGARQFLVDLVDNFAAVFRESEFYSLPCYPATVPDLAGQLASDPEGAASGQVQACSPQPSTGPRTSASPATPPRRPTRSSTPSSSRRCSRASPATKRLPRTPSRPRKPRSRASSNVAPRLRGICAFGAPASDSAGCGLDRSPDPAQALHFRGARLGSLRPSPYYGEDSSRREPGPERDAAAI